MTGCEGGCFCGAVRYRVEGEPPTCRLLPLPDVPADGGRPGGGMGDVAARALRLDSVPSPGAYRSAPGRRPFCGECGTHLLFGTRRRPALFDVNVATLDDPAGVRPGYHIWTASRIPWFETADQLPRHMEEREQG